VSRFVIGGGTLPKHIFQGVSFGLVSELVKFYIDFSPLGDRNSMLVLFSAIELSIFRPLSRMEV